MAHPGQQPDAGADEPRAEEAGIEAQETEPVEPARFGRLTAVSSAMRRVFEELEAVARSESSVIIEGETGTGKELAGEAIHDHSPRARGPFVVVDCASIPPELIESELFGHVQGAFTGALSDRTGAFEAAHRGSIFIDELGELPLNLQPKLLRVLEQRSVKKVGATSQRPVDVRVICATNRDLFGEVRAGRFREDLYFRLAVSKVRIPPLRARRDDILFLAERFLDDFPTTSGARLEIEGEARERLLAYGWPGNVRELRNVVDRGALLSDKTFRIPDDFGSAIGLDLDDEYAPGAGTWLAGAPGEPSEDGMSSAATLPGQVTRPLWQGLTYKDARATVMADFERGYVLELLEANKGNVSAAARAAGIHRNQFHGMMSRYGIQKPGGKKD